MLILITKSGSIIKCINLMALFSPLQTEIMIVANWPHFCGAHFVVVGRAEYIYYTRKWSVFSAPHFGNEQYFDLHLSADICLVYGRSTFVYQY